MKQPEDIGQKYFVPALQAQSHRKVVFTNEQTIKLVVTSEIKYIG